MPGKSWLVRFEIERSPASGALFVPATIPCFTYRRMSWPPTQRMPAPNGTPAAIGVGPCRKMHVEPEYMFVPVNVTDPGSTESADRLAVPAAERIAPGLPVFAQPAPAPLGFPHTQACTPPAFGMHIGEPADPPPTTNRN